MTRIDEALAGRGSAEDGPGIIFLPEMGFDAGHPPPGSQTEHDHAAVQLTVVFPKSRAAAVAWRTETGTRRNQLLTEASVSITPSGQPHEIRANGADRVLMFLSPTLVENAAHDLLPASPLPIRERYGVRDAFTLELARAVRAEIHTSAPRGRVYLESLATVLTSYLLRQDLVTAAQPGRSMGRLDQRRLTRVVDFIEAHLHEEVTLRTLADVAGLSAFHFARAFRAATGLSPHRYLITVRIERARTLLHDDRLSILDVANQVGFADQSHFAAVFRRESGQSPSKFRRAD